MRFVAIKTPAQMDLLALHRVRSRLVSRRTAVINQIRGFLIERGIAVAKGPRALRKVLPDILASADDVLSPMIVRLIEELCEDWRCLDVRVDNLTEEIGILAQEDPCCQRLMTVPGIGPTIASAIVAAVGNASGFTDGRDLSAWLGLVPRQMSTGDRTILGRISKRGNRYVRTLLVQAAHIILVRRPQSAAGLRPWIETASRRLHRNVLVIALANKLARIAWAVLSRGCDYQPRAAVQVG
jgi:transposase